MRAKICGLRDPAHAALAVANGAWAVGVVLHPPSPRHATTEQARAVVAAVGGRAETVLVVVDPDPAALVRQVAATGASMVQLHGERVDVGAVRAAVGPELGIIRAVAHDGPDRDPRGADLLLVDGPRPGAGRPWDWASALVPDPGVGVIAAGGLTAAGLTGLGPVADRLHAVDVSSGVESAPGTKEPALIVAFLAAAARSTAAVA